jgi:hypothetical protein
MPARVVVWMVMLCLRLRRSSTSYDPDVGVQRKNVSGTWATVRDAMAHQRHTVTQPDRACENIAHCVACLGREPPAFASEQWLVNATCPLSGVGCNAH